MTGNKARRGKDTGNRETFRYCFAHEFDITALRELISEKKIPAVPESAPVKTIAEALQYQHYRKGEDGRWVFRGNPLLSVSIDMEAAEKIPEEVLSEPILFVMVPSGEKFCPVLIDGHHRLAKAYHSGKEELPALIVSPRDGKEAKQFYSHHGRVPGLFDAKKARRRAKRPY